MRLVLEKSYFAEEDAFLWLLDRKIYYLSLFFCYTSLYFNLFNYIISCTNLIWQSLIRQYALYLRVQFFTKMELSVVGILMKSVESLFIGTPQNLIIMSRCCCLVRSLEYMELLHKKVSPIKNLHKHYFFLLLCIFSRKLSFL